MKIYKYSVDTDIFTRKMPQGAKPLCVQMQHETPQLWMLVDPGAPLVERKMMTVGTGHSMDPGTDAADYIGTFQMHGGSLVIHLFDLGET